MIPPRTHTPHIVETTPQRTAPTHLTIPNNEILDIGRPKHSEARASNAS